MTPTLFFDLDGTLIDSAIGITRCMAFALERVQHPVPDDATLRAWIGPALRTSFAPLLNDATRTEDAVNAYLERFDSVGWTEHTLYPGIADVVAALHDAGHTLAVVTAKNEPHARRIVSHLPFGHLFEDVIGATTDGVRSQKPELIAEALLRLQREPAECTMIGDRKMDIGGARHHGMANIGVLWGFGSEEELREAGADRLVAAPRELLAAAA